MIKGFLFWYLVVSIIVAGVDIYIAIKACQKKGKMGRSLAIVGFLAMVVDLTYFASITSKDLMFVSVMSSIYFVCIDWMLVSLFAFIVMYARINSSKATIILNSAFGLAALFDTVVEFINPFTNISVTFTYRDTMFAFYAYEMHPLFYVHLAIAYSMIVLVVGVLIYRIRMVASQYRNQYKFIVFGILLIVVVNAIFLIPADNSLLLLLDVSVCGYSVVLAFVYWSCYNYTKTSMLKGLSMTIFDNVDQGIVLFDYDEKMVIRNARAAELLGKESFVDDMEMNKFLGRLEVSEKTIAHVDNYTTQCVTLTNGRELPRRCDFRRLKDDKGQIIGNLFVFTDSSIVTDPITGFLSWEVLKQNIVNRPESYSRMEQVLIVDINGLSTINNNYGTVTGDKRIKELADLMKRYLPKGTLLVRGQDAQLCAFSQINDDRLKLEMENVKQMYSGTLQYSIGKVGKDGENLYETIVATAKAMKKKKLMDFDSVHSQSLNSLVRALEECDSDTEAHVQRTRKMGSLLADKIGLTDCQKTDLDLLCLLHDIGKIGVPLEILNKPGKLTPEEFGALKIHVEKGYQIALSSKDLSDIADMIRHHHERWDGKGYPSGLKGTQIPLLSRVISVVDSYDAMVSDRTYRKSIGVENAIAELEKFSGSQFDPEIVKIFIDMLKQNPEMMTENKNERIGEVVDPMSRKEILEAPSGNRLAIPVAHPVVHSRYILDTDENIISVDDNFEIITGYSRKEAMNMTQIDLIPEEGRTDYVMLIQQLFKTTNMVYLEHKLQKKDGTILYVFCQGKRYFDSVANAGRAEVIIADSSDTYFMTFMRDAENGAGNANDLTRGMASRRDELTRLLRFDAFQTDTNNAIKGDNNKLMMLAIDVDGFKDFEKIYGSVAGNEQLVFIAKALRKSLRSNDLACRVKDDEFAAVMTFSKNHSDELMIERATQLFDKINTVIKSSIGGTTISMGVTISSENDTPDTMFDRASQALKKARSHGRCCMAVERGDK